MGIFFRLLSYLPLRLLHTLGAGLGYLVYLLTSTYRKHLQANLDLALGNAATPQHYTAAAYEAGKQALELPKVWLRSLEEVAGRVVQISGWELVAAARASNKGLIFLTPHLGCFEITAQYISTHFPITVMYRPPKMAWLHQMVITGRTREQLKLAPADVSGVRSLVKCLRKGEAIGLLPDQAPKVGEGVWCPFFGKQAYTMTLAARLSETGATVLRIWAERLPQGAGYHIHISPPQTPLTGNTAERAAQINREMEALIRECPSQYLWGYNRYKRPGGADAPPVENLLDN